MIYCKKRVDLWKTAQAGDSDFGDFEPVEPGASLHLSIVVSAAAVLTIRAYRDKGEPGETFVDMDLNAGQALIPGALFQDELEGIVVPVEAYAFRLSAAVTVEKLLVTEVK